MASLLFGLIFLALSTLNGVSASIVEYPEVIPGPGLPSLVSLGLTSKDLYERTAPALENGERGLLPLYDRICYDNGCGRVPRGDAQACINYLAALGTTRCEAPSATYSSVVMCSAGVAQIIGSNYRGGGPVSSYCSDVALGGQNVINYCTDGNNNVAGADAANGNGDLIVAIEKCCPCS